MAAAGAVSSGALSAADGVDDVVHPLVGFVVGVVDARGGRRLENADVEIAEIAIVNEWPPVPSGPDDADQAVQRVFDQIGDDATAAAVDDPGAHDHRSQRRRGCRQDEVFVLGAPRHVVGRIERRRVLHLKSNDEGSTISKDIKGKVNLKETPILEWRWKVTKLPRGGDARKAATDDEAGQIYLTWPRFPEQVNLYQWLGARREKRAVCEQCPWTTACGRPCD